MQRFVFVRVLQGIVTLVALSLMVFFIPRLAGNPLDLLLPLQATQEDYRQAAIRLGLDRPLYEQYLLFITHSLVGDFGNSVKSAVPVMELILTRLPNSMALAGVSMLFSLALAIPLGVVAATRRGTAVDSLFRVIAVLGQSVPQFWLGLMLILLFSIKLNVLPPFGMDSWKHYLMPAFTLGAGIVTAGVMRLLRSSMIDALGSEYVKLARVKGVSETGVVWKHALRNAIMPVITFSGVYFALLIGLAVVVETVFAWPGLGRLSYEAVLWKDYPVIQGVVMFTAVIVMIVNLLVDILYAYVDPRIRYD
jgi:peptide/nickel transport system permease protein